MTIICALAHPSLLDIQTLNIHHNEQLCKDRKPRGHRATTKPNNKQKCI